MKAAWPGTVGPSGGAAQGSGPSVVGAGPSAGTEPSAWLPESYNRLKDRVRTMEGARLSYLNQQVASIKALVQEGKSAGHLLPDMVRYLRDLRAGGALVRDPTSRPTTNMMSDPRQPPSPVQTERPRSMARPRTAPPRCGIPVPRHPAGDSGWKRPVHAPNNPTVCKPRPKNKSKIPRPTRLPQSRANRGRSSHVTVQTANRVHGISRPAHAPHQTSPAPIVAGSLTETKQFLDKLQHKYGNSKTADDLARGLQDNECTNNPKSDSLSQTKGKGSSRAGLLATSKLVLTGRPSRIPVRVSLTSDPPGKGTRQGKVKEIKKSVSNCTKSASSRVMGSRIPIRKCVSFLAVS